MSGLKSCFGMLHGPKVSDFMQSERPPRKRSFIIGLPIGEPQQGDHKNGVTLDCRRKNLRPATQQQNNYNQRINCRNTSGHKHVSWSKEKKKWVVRMRVDGKMKHIGYRDTFEDACKLAEEAEKKYHGEFARAK